MEDNVVMSKYSDNMPPDIQAAIGWLYEYINESSSVLDVGCSTGYFGEFIKKNKRCRVYGIEISDDRISAAKVLDKVFSFDLDTEWPRGVLSQKFDYIFFGDVIEHLKNPEKSLRAASKMLNKGGYIFVSTPNVAHISVRLELLGGGFEYESMGILDNTHLKYFTRNSLNDLVKASGLSVKVEDMSTNDIPKELINLKLESLGLNANDKFWKMVELPEARAYQFKLVLSTEKDKIITSKKVNKKPLQYRDDYVSRLKNESAELLKHADEQAKIIAEISDDLHKTKKSNELLEVEILSLKKSKFRKIKDRIKSK